nr:MAG TPA: hypothetical protein [Bacteriophage sp.]
MYYVFYLKIFKNYDTYQYTHLHIKYRMHITLKIFQKLRHLAHSQAHSCSHLRVGC